MQACNDQQNKRKEAKQARDERKASDESHSISESSCGSEGEVTHSNLRRGKTNALYVIECQRLEDLDVDSLSDSVTTSSDEAFISESDVTLN
jgi:hypothetical protein